MTEQLAGAIIISLLHGLIPSHWLPMLSIGKKYGWPLRKILFFSFQTAMAHALSTVVIGIVISLGGGWIAHQFDGWYHWIPAMLLIGLGCWFIYRHYKHHHFHVHPDTGDSKPMIWPLLLAMFLSPCLEIEGYFFTMASAGWFWIMVLSLIYITTTLLSMLTWVWIAYRGLEKIDAHKWTHNAGIITGLVLIVSGILFLLD
jgi:putative Mn2+ efflux pump MntP